MKNIKDRWSKQIKASLLAVSCVMLAGCQTNPSHSDGTASIDGRKGAANAMSANEWLAQSAMPQVVDRPLTAAEAAYVLRKVGFEPAPPEVAPWIGRNRSELLVFLLDGATTAPVIASPDWTAQAPRYWGQDGRSQAERNAFRVARQQEVGGLRSWWVKQMLATPSPLGERMTLFWENTFVAGFSGLDERSHAQWQHHMMIRQHALGNYRDFLRAVVQDPAVLIYLDNNRNTKASPNENLARELLELYTLGESNYSEQDIKESARALAGWHVAQFGPVRFFEKAWARDYTVKNIFGKRGNFDGHGLVDLILQQPAASRYVPKRLWAEFVSSEPPPEEAIAHWGQAFRETGFDIKALLTVVLNSHYFWEEQYVGSSVKSPVELVVGAVRATQTKNFPISRINSALGNLGQTLFDPPDVSGWGYGEYWLNPVLLIEREQLQNDIAQAIGDSMAKKAMPVIKGATPTRTLKLKLAGEAYQGPPGFVVRLFHEGGVWLSDRYLLASARDTERFGRYKNEADWIWETVELGIPNDLKGISKLEVYFGPDAAGNGGDRNLFVGAVQWDGLTIPGAMGRQSPGCRGDADGKTRHPDRLYCSGNLRFDLNEIRAAVAKNDEKPVANPTDVLTKELVLLWLKSPSESGWQGADFMFDSLSFGGRNWDYFGFKFALDDRGRFLVSVDEDRCAPSCFERWPMDAWKDKSGLRHVSIYLNNYENWSLKQYYQLKGADKELVKAIVALAPKAKDLILSYGRADAPDTQLVWTKRLDRFIEMGKQRRWQPDTPLVLRESVPQSRDGGAGNMMRMSNMMSGGNRIESEAFALATGVLPSASEWHQALETHLSLASEPLEAWMLSVQEGGRLVDVRDVITSPFLNLK